MYTARLTTVLLQDRFEGKPTSWDGDFQWPPSHAQLKPLSPRLGETWNWQRQLREHYKVRLFYRKLKASIPVNMLMCFLGHLRSNFFLLKIFDRKEIERRVIFLTYFFLVDRHRMICNTTLLGYHMNMALNWGQTLILASQSQHIGRYALCFNVPRRERCDWVWNITVAFYIQKLPWVTRFSENLLFRLDLHGLQILNIFP